MPKKKAKRKVKKLRKKANKKTSRAKKVKRTVRKAKARKRAKAPQRKKIASSAAVPKAALKRATSKQAGEYIGKVTHYFPHVNAAVVVVEKGVLKIGDNISIKGHTTLINQKVESMQVDHVPIQEAKKGDEIGLQVPGRVREHDVVFKVK